MKGLGVLAVAALALFALSSKRTGSTAPSTAAFPSPSPEPTPSPLPLVLAPAVVPTPTRATEAEAAAIISPLSTAQREALAQQIAQLHHNKYAFELQATGGRAYPVTMGIESFVVDQSAYAQFLSLGAQISAIEAQLRL